MQRRFDLNRHRAWVGEGSATFPLLNLSGQMVGYQKYTPNAQKHCSNPTLARYFTRSRKDVVLLWGLESFYCADTLFVCEGVFDAAAVTYWGGSAVATLSSECNKSTLQWLSLISSVRHTVLVLDKDEKGARLSKYCWDVYVPDTNYLGDASDKEVLAIMQRFQ